MSHDELPDVDREVRGDVIQVPHEAVAASSIPDSPYDSQPFATLELDSSLMISDVGEYHAVLLRHLVSDCTLHIDGSRVESVDGAGLQLLAAFIKDLLSRSSTVKWLGVSEKLLKSARDMGISAALQLENSNQNT